DDVRADVDLAAVVPFRHLDADGRTWVFRWVVSGPVLDLGYHRATVEVGGGAYEASVIVAPARMPALEGPPLWGLFAPTYSFVPPGEPGVDHLGLGHLGHLGDLAARAAAHGARVVSTLPLLATFLDEPFEP